MRAKNFLIVSIAMTTLSSMGQTPKPGFGDKGCPQKSLFPENVTVSGDDFIEVHQLPSYGNGPVYIARVYGDGRLAWHGEKTVLSIGDASASVNAVQAKALIENARRLGFGSLCDEYAMRMLDGGISVTTLSIGGQVKVVTNPGPSDAPSWLYKLNEQIASFDSVQKLIGVRQGRPELQK
jgi:hypothetical protein